MNNNHNHNKEVYYNNGANSALFIGLVLFLLSPLLGLLYALRKPNSRSSYIIYSLFIVYFGFSMFFDGSVRYDGLLIAYNFQEWSKLGFNDYINRITSIFSINSLLSDKDLFEVTLSYLVSRFTSNYHIFFMFVAIFYAFFMPRVMRYFTSINRTRYNYYYYVLFYLFIPLPLTAIAGVRFGLATWMFLYAFYKISIDDEKQYVFLLLSTPLVHLSFLFAIVVYAIYVILKGKYKIWLLLLILSYVFSELSLTWLKDSVDSYTGMSSWVNWVDTYARFNEVNDIEEGGTGFYWVVPIFNVLTRVFLLLLLLFTYKNRKLFDSDSSSKKVFSFTLACYTISNFCMPIPHLGARFITLCYPSLAYLWLKYSLDRRYKPLLLAVPFVFLLSIKQAFDVYANSLEYSFLITPFYNIIHYLLFNTPITPSDVNQFLF